jgi:tetratricopeptide (TPR) repeat protein
MRYILPNPRLPFIPVTIVLLTMSAVADAAGSSTGADVAREAYELRMSGEAAKARDLLQEAIAKAPDQAAAQYELSRTLLHLALANPRELMGNLELAHQAIGKATEIEPDNVIYRLFSGRIAFVRAYAAMQSEDPAAGKLVEELINAYDEVLHLMPKHEPTMLYLVELYRTVPPELGGSPDKANEYAAMLDEAPGASGAKARALLLPEDGDLVEYWQDALDGDEDNLDFMEELGRSLLYRGQPEKAAELYHEVAQKDPERCALMLDLGRYYAMTGWRDESRRKELLPLAEAAIEEYLDCAPVRPLRGFALGLQLRIASAMGDKARAEDLGQAAAEADPYYSKAFGTPTAELFVPPGEIPEVHRYLFRPY